MMPLAPPPNRPVTSALRYDYASASDTGRMRQNNEDALGVDAATGLVVLADGMGGYNAGEVASQLAVDGLMQRLTPWLAGAGRQAEPATLGPRLQTAIGETNQQILDAARRHPAWAGMGTTLVLAVLQAQGVQLAHIGDSRAYRWGPRGLQQLSRDHSLLQEQIDAGLIAAAQAHAAAHRHLVTRALGVEPGVQAELAWHPLQAGDGLLLCSDGLSDMLDEAGLSRLLDPDAPLQPTAQALVEAANQAGGRDNISLVLIRALGPAVPARRWWSRRRG